MQAAIGDRMHVHSRAVGQTEQVAVVIEIHGENGAPPYLVRYDNGHEALIFPGPDCTIEHAKSKQQA